MPKIPIIGPMIQGVDETVPQQGGITIIDGYIDEGGALNKRPGLYAFLNTGTQLPVTGVYWWREKQLLIVVSGGQTFVVTSVSTVSAATDISPVDKTLWFGTDSPVIFAATERWLYMTSGGRVMAWNGSVSNLVQDAGAPMARCSHIAYIDGYIVGNSVDTQGFYHTDLLSDSLYSPFTWSSVGANAEGAPDPIMGVYTGWRELVIFGFKTIEFWYNSGQDFPFSRIDGTFIETGCIARYSPVRADNTWFWLNENREVVRLEGRTPKVISQPVSEILRDMSKVDDAIGTLVDYFYVLSFPYADYTLVFNLRTQTWSIWSKWEPEQNGYHRWIGQVGEFVPEWNVHIVGARRGGQVCVFDKSLMTDNGELIRTVYRSAHFDHGTLRRKRSNRLYLRVKRGT